MKPRPSGLPHWIDLSFGQLRESIQAESNYGSEAEHELAATVVAATGWDGDRREQGEAAWNALLEVERDLEERASAIAQEFSSAQWLWYLRRASWLWYRLNLTATTGPYVGHVAEAASAWSTTPTPDVPGIGKQLVFPTDAATARAVLRMRAAAVLLYDVHGSLRWAGKGAPILARPGGMPHNDSDPELRRLIRLYDRRTAAEVPGGILSKAGLFTPSSRTVPDGGAHVPFVGRTRAGRYGLGPIDLAGIALLLDDQVPVEMRWPRAFLDLALLLWGTLLCDAVRERIEIGQIPFEGTGYRVVNENQALGDLDKAIWVVSRDRFGGLLPAAVELGTPEEVLGRLRGQSASVWSPTTPTIRPLDDEWLIVDLAGASLRLADALSRPDVSGAMVNVWSQHFERSVQEAINGTGWRPSPDLLARRGRTLRRDGRALTDIDAVGERGGTLLIVSCKGVPYSDAWDRGEYQAVRKIATNVEGSVAAWSAFVDTLREQRIGDNFDFSSYRRIVGVVVYPHTPWIASRQFAREATSGLFIASAAAELTEWCRRSKW